MSRYYEGLIGKTVTLERVIVVDDGLSGYFPVAIKLDDGSIFAVLRSGSGHISADGKLVAVRSHDGGKSWSRPKTIIDMPEDVRGPPALGQSFNGNLILAFNLLKGFRKGYTGHVGTPDYKFRNYLIDVWIPELSDSKCYYTLSSDGGFSWSDPTPLEIPGLSIAPYGRIVELSDKTLLMNVYGVKGNLPTSDRHSSYVIRSRDGGKTWGEPSLIAEGFNETALLVIDGDTVIAALRADPPAESIYISISDDGGYTWSKPKEVTGNLEHPADLIQLEDGSIFLVHGYRKVPYGVRGLVSRDRGKTWTSSKIILAADGRNQDCGYPTAIRTDDGKVVVLYYLVGSLIEDDMKLRCIAVRVEEKYLVELF